jgi:hypothetical protein
MVVSYYRLHRREHFHLLDPGAHICVYSYGRRCMDSTTAHRARHFEKGMMPLQAVSDH